MKRLLLPAVVAALASAGCLVLLTSSSPPRVVDLDELTAHFVAQMPRSGSEGMRLPTAAEASAFLEGVQAAGAGDLDEARRLLAPLHYTVEAVSDEVSGRRLLVLAEQRDADGNWSRGWGLFVLAADPAEPLVVEVAHPLFDVHTPEAGLAAFRRGNARALLVAGTHRYANDDGSSDVAHDERTMFARVDAALVTASDTVLQPHGFDDSGSGATDERDVVLSSGTDSPGIAITDAANRIRRAGFEVCTYDGTSCSDLAGTQNVEGAHCRKVGARFVHLEMGRATRDDADRRTTIVNLTVDALADNPVETRAGS